MRDLTIGLVQQPLAWHDAPANRALLGDAVRRLPDSPGLVLLPEMFTSGFTMAPGEVAEAPGGPTEQWMAALASETRAVIAGSIVVTESGSFFNRLLWVSPDGTVLSYDKRHLFRMAREHRHYEPGTKRMICEVGGWRVCPLVCYDLRFPVWSRGIDEFDLLVYVANWPAARRSAWRTLLPARAVENLCYTAGLNRIGNDANKVRYAGDSAVYDYLGNPLAELGDDPACVTVRLDGAALTRYREKFPAWRDADEFTVDI